MSKTFLKKFYNSGLWKSSYRFMMFMKGGAIGNE